MDFVSKEPPETPSVIVVIVVINFSSFFYILPEVNLGVLHNNLLRTMRNWVNLFN